MSSLLHKMFNASKNVAMESIRNWCSKHQSGENNLEMVLQNIKSSSLVEADKLYLKYNITK